MEKARNSPLPPLWQKMRVVSTMLASILIPLVIALVSQSFAATLKQNEIGVRYIEMAVGILRAPPEPATNHVRTWAIDVINYHSEVPLSEEVLIELQNEDVSDLLSAFIGAG